MGLEKSLYFLENDKISFFPVKAIIRENGNEFYLWVFSPFPWRLDKKWEIACFHEPLNSNENEK